MKISISFILAVVTVLIASVGINATTIPYNMYVEPGTHSCVVTWDDDDNSAWNLRYRLAEPIEEQHFSWDFEDMNIDDWTLIDADGDGRNWVVSTTTSFSYAHSGSVSLTSASYVNNLYLDPDNWLISPKVPLDGTLSLWMGQRSSTYRDNFAIYVCVGDFTSTDDFVKVSDDYAPRSWTEFIVDLREYAGEEGYFAIRHYNSYYKWALFVDDISIYIPSKDHEWIYVNDLQKMEYTIEDLEMETDYEVQVQAIGDDGTLSDWCRPDVFTTLDEEPIITSVHIMGEINDQIWSPDAGTKMEYDPDSELYTVTFFIKEGRAFGFTTELDMDDQGDWNNLLPYRFGPECDGVFLLTDEYLGQQLPLTFEHWGNIHIVSSGEYAVTVSLEQRYIIVEKVGEPAHGYQTGDVNHDNFVNIEDLTSLIDRLLNGPSIPVCMICADVDNDGLVNINDLTKLIDNILNGN